MEKGGNSGNIGARKPILALGELLVDLVPGREGMRIEDAGPVVKTASGSAGIFACAATLLGGRGGFIGKVGRDSLSRMVAGTLRGPGVDLSRLIVSDEGQMGLAFLEYLPEGRNYQYYRKNSVGSLLRASELDAEYISGASAVHFPGMLLASGGDRAGEGDSGFIRPKHPPRAFSGCGRTGAPAVGGAPCGRSGAHIERGADDYG